MGERFERNEFFQTKIAALLHDPPDKPWHVMGHLPEGHEKVAREILDGLGLGDLKRLLESRAVRDADVLAASVDRWFAKAVESRKITLVNFFSGQEIKELRPPSDKIPHKWIEELRDFIEASPEELRYHLLYALAEPCYLKNYPNCLGPADTRIPHHSVFDHTYLTATLVNWCYRTSKPRGLLVHIDLAGVQKYIQASRKVRDLWVSSWFVSLATWHLIEELIEKVGPDVVFLPTCRLNPFYYHWLLRKLEKTGYRRMKDLKNFLGQFSILGHQLSLAKPTIPLIPGSLLLILPPYDILSELLGWEQNVEPEKALIEYFSKRHKDFFEKLVEKTVEEIGKKDLTKEFWAKIKEALNEPRCKETPPLLLRAAVVRLPEDLRKLEDLKKFAQELSQLGVSELDLVYSLAYKELGERMKLLKKVKSYPTLMPPARALEGGEWIYCTTCGVQPAVFDVPRRRAVGGEGREETEKAGYETFVPEEERPYFDEGEHLCFYCLLKRLAGHDGLSPLPSLTGIDLPRSIRSTSWYSAFSLLEWIANLSKEEREKAKAAFDNPRYQRKIEEFIRGEEDPVERRRLEQLNLSAKLKAILDFARPQTLRALKEDERIDQVIEALYSIGLPKMEEGLRPPFGAYFTIIRADADNVGKLLTGHLSYIFSISEQERKKSEGDAKALFRERDVQIVAEALHRVISATDPTKSVQLDSIKQILEKIAAYDLPLVWPSYHVCISRALMFSALADHVLPEKCGAPEGFFLVYSGGDDLLMISSPAQALCFVRESRKFFGDESFLPLSFGEGETFYPTIAPATRSYVISLFHFKHPLSRALAQTTEGMEEFAKKVQVTLGQAYKEKDALLFSYVPRGSILTEEVPSGILPLDSEFGDFYRIFDEVFKMIENGILSHSTVFDLLNLVQRDEILREHPDLYLTLIRRVLERNLQVEKEQELARIDLESLRNRLLLTLSLAGRPKPTSVFAEFCKALQARMVALRVREG